MRFKKLISGLLACVLAVTSVFAVNVISAEADSPSGVGNSANVIDTSTNPAVVADYDFSKVAGGRLEDKSPYKNDAVVHGKVDCDKEAAIMALKENSYVDLPMGIMDSLTDAESFTIEVKFAKSAVCGDEAWLFCLGSKADADPVENALFFSPNSGRGMGVHIVNKDGEKTLVKLGAARKGRYYTVNMVFDHGIINLYVDGRRVGTADGLDSGCSMKNDIVAAGTENGVLGFIGKSCQSGGSGFAGSLASFKIYDKAMTAAEIFGNRFLEMEENVFFTQTVLGSNKDKEHIIYDLKLPGRVGEYESVTWNSEPNVIAADGKVFNPRDKDIEIRLTATAKRGDDLEAARDFIVKVPKLDTSALEALISKVSNVKEEDYTQETWKPYAAALVKAKQAVAGSAKLGQSDLARLHSLLQSCYHALYRQYKVTLNYGYAGAPAVAPLYVKKGGKVDKSKLPQNPKRNGYNFAGWYKGSKAFNFKSSVTGTITLKAKWTKLISIAKSSVRVPKVVYNGKGRKPKVTVKYKGKTLKSGKNYTLQYINNKKPGYGSVVVKGKGDYNGSKKVKLAIVPKASKISKAVNKKGKKLAVKFRKSAGASGYELYYATNSKFKPARKVKTSKTSVTLKRLKKGTYYVRVRAYKKGKPTLYSAYSKVKKIKVTK